MENEQNDEQDEQVDLPIEAKPRARRVSRAFYSNCLIQAIWHKLLHPFKTKIVIIPKRINESDCMHCFWSDDTGDYDFSPTNPSPTLNVFWFKGYVQKRGKGFAEKYKARRIRVYRKEQNND